jgi:hypothetical protein
MSIAAALWVARAVGRMSVADALRDRAVDLPTVGRSGAVTALALFAAGFRSCSRRPCTGFPSAGMPPSPHGLGAAVAAVAPLCRALLGRLAPPDATIATLASRRCGTCRGTWRQAWRASS